MSIAVIGAGYVGLTTAVAFASTAAAASWMVCPTRSCDAGEARRTPVTTEE